MTRIATDALGATEPSASLAPRRFSPVFGAPAEPTPVLYAGEDLGCALGETVFHDLPDDASTPAELFRADLVTLRASVIEVKRDIQLADLTDEVLEQLGYERDEVIATPPIDYAVTRLWGQLAWDSGEVNGLVWNSRRSPDRLSFMLFVHENGGAPARFAPQLGRRSDLDCVSAPVPLYDGPGLAAVLDQALARNVTVVI